MSDAGRTLAVAEAYEWAIDVFESMDREDALDYLRRVAARQRESYEREIEYARIARILSPAYSADVRVGSTVEPGRVT